MREFRHLLQVLNKESKLQDKLLLILAEERSKIVHLQREELEKLSEKKEELLYDLSILKKERHALLSHLSTAFKVDPAQIKISTITNFCDDKNLSAAINDVASKLREIVVKVNELNASNGILLKQSLGLLSSTISIMTARPQANNTSYGRNAKVAAEDEKELTIVSSFNRSV
jgi:flagellar biosynthesis/type III secretory pathway chaperone